MSRLIAYFLRLFAKYYLKKNNIEVIAITGSAGKTTTKFILSKLVSDNETYIPNEAYNTEIGIPLAIFKEKVPSKSKSIFAWLIVLIKIKIKFLKKAPYKRIILEFGADKPGDILYFMSFIKPKISVVTSVLPTHLEKFKDIQAVEKEKGNLVEFTDPTGYVILNNDDERVGNMANRTKARIITFGRKGGSSFQYDKVEFEESGKLSFYIRKDKKHFYVKTNFLGEHFVPSILSALAVINCMGFELEDKLGDLENIFPEKGRMRLLEGINQGLIIDDSYNANPESALAALEVLNRFEGRKIAVLGSMNELGDYEKEGHEKVSKKAVEVADLIIFVGRKTKEYSLEIALEGLNKNCVQYFQDPYKAGEYLAGIIRKGDVVLFKGSQNGVFLEEAVKKILKRPIESEELLVRQSKMWQDKKEKFRKSLREDNI